MSNTLLFEIKYCTPMILSLLLKPIRPIFTIQFKIHFLLNNLTVTSSITDTGVTVYSLHPGVVDTNLSRHLDKTVFPGAKWMFQNLGGVFMKSPEQGAQTTLYCAVDEKTANETGLYYE